MTRFDPFSYGQVSLGAGKQAAPEGDAEDLLFQAQEAHQAPAPADDDWSLPPAQPSELAGFVPEPQEAAAFGRDILGEAIEAPQAAPVPVAAEGAPSGATREVGRRPLRPLSVAAAAPATESPKRSKSALPGSGSSRFAAVVVPLGITIVGGLATSWLWAMQQNVVMGVIAGAATAVAALFAWLLCRG
jgi:hypothetical protein